MLPPRLWPGHGRPGRIGLLLAGSKGAYFIDATAANVAPCLHDAVMRKGRDYQFDLHYAGGDYQLLGRAGYFVRRMLDGAPPGDLPVEPPTVVELWINLVTARAPGVEIPLALQTADRIFD